MKIYSSDMDIMYIYYWDDHSLVEVSGEGCRYNIHMFDMSR